MHPPQETAAAAAPPTPPPPPSGPPPPLPPGGDDEEPSGGWREQSWPRVWQGPFLEALSRLPIATSACHAASISANVAYHWRRTSAEFAVAWMEALNEGLDRMEQELYRRGMVGIEHKTVRTSTRARQLASGETVTDTETVETVETNVETGAIVTMLKAYRPERYRERYEHHHSAPDGGPVRYEDVGAQPRTAERLLGLIHLARQYGLEPGAVPAVIEGNGTPVVQVPVPELEPPPDA